MVYLSHSTFLTLAIDIFSHMGFVAFALSDAIQVCDSVSCQFLLLPDSACDSVFLFFQKAWAVRVPLFQACDVYLIGFGVLILFHYCKTPCVNFPGAPQATICWLSSFLGPPSLMQHLRPSRCCNNPETSRTQNQSQFRLGNDAVRWCDQNIFPASHLFFIFVGVGFCNSLVFPRF